MGWILINALNQEIKSRGMVQFLKIHTFPYKLKKEGKNNLDLGLGGNEI